MEVGRISQAVQKRFVWAHLLGGDLGISNLGRQTVMRNRMAMVKEQ